MIPTPLARWLYLRQTRWRGEDADRHLERLLASQWLSPRELEERQWQKLTALVAHAYGHSPWHRAAFDREGVKPHDLRAPADLARFPLLGKNDLRLHAREIAVTTGRYRHSQAKSSGSTGQSVKFAKDRHASGNGRAAMLRGHSWYGVGIGAREASLWGVPLGRRARATARLRDLFLNRFRQASFDLDDRNLGAFYERMRRTRPAYLMGYSSLVHGFARWLAERRIDASGLALRMVKVTAESLFDDQRALIEEVFAAPVAREYGAAEVGIVAFDCPERKLHIAAEGVYVEELESDLPGAGAELVVTDLDNRYTPILRYRLGDFGRLGTESCPCGRGLPLLDRVVGRTSDVVVGAEGERYHSSIFSYILKEITGRDGGIAQYKVHQRRAGALEFEIVRSAHFTDETRRFLEATVARELGSAMAIAIRYVDGIAREPSGKLRYFVSHLDERSHTGSTAAKGRP